MTCSKTSIENLPEIASEIIQYCRNDFSTLHSCILVNRLWCRLVIPILWEDPFSIKSPKNHHIFNVTLSNLNDDDKAKLKEYKISSHLLFPLNTLFNYPSFIKCLSINKLVKFISDFVKKNTYSISSFPLLCYSYDCYKSEIFIFFSLIKLFIKNNANLHTLEFRTSDIFNLINGECFELILQNPNFLCNIKNLSVIFDRCNIWEKIPPFFKFLCSNCNTISSIYYQCQYNTDNTVFMDYISQKINSQQILYKILFDRSTLLLSSSLRNSNCLNFLNTIVFNNVDLSNTTFLNESFERLNVLESIHILNCILSSNFIQQIINLTKPFKLRSLFTRENLQTELLQLLLQKSGSYLENIGFESIYNDQLEQQLFEIKNYCNKIKFISLLEFDQNIHSTINLIKDIKENLNYLSINFHGFYGFYNDIFIEFSSIILLNLGQILPLKLKYLNLSLIITNTNDLEVFLRNSQNTFINKLLIRCKILDENMNILPYIEEYIMKKKRVNYLAIEERYNRISKDSPSLKTQAKKFESYNIKVQNYDDLYIQICDFVNELY
ncbi:hypothetical protein RclHR1_05220003 [Rhizophagus clarus]|uniref:F-box domain-containing protein n=1 Tax=Rhizophagus clarus TaxID=94130 RepID=A0A2Z6RLE8_9GLOM|nr:hypothetical protein RclHR1_05220003 [Rhizophagus clarus]GES79151.1 hypothetical protein GLOIN_2v1867510 [Rhizophagus clarus]